MNAPMRIFVAPIVPLTVMTLVLVAGCEKTAESPREVSSVELHEASMNFDPENVQPFLKRVSGLVDSGFGDSEAQRVLQSMQGLSPDQEATSEYQVVYRKESVKLRVRVVMSDIDAPDLFFFSDKVLAEAIQGEMIRFAEEKGL
jgi:hypothetical protein